MDRSTGFHRSGFIAIALVMLAMGIAHGQAPATAENPAPPNKLTPAQQALADKLAVKKAEAEGKKAEAEGKKAEAEGKKAEAEAKKLAAEKEKASEKATIGLTVPLPSPGKQLTASAFGCGSTQPKSCARAAMPLGIQVCSSVDTGCAHPIGVKIAVKVNGTDFSIDLAHGLEAGQQIQVAYGDEKHPHQTDWRPVVPVATDIDCCSFKATEVTVWIPIQTPLTLRGLPAKGMPFRVLVAKPTEDWKWHFTTTGKGQLVPGDSVSIGFFLDGTFTELAKMQWDAGSGSTGGSGGGKGATDPVTSLNPWVSSTGVCPPPTVAPERTKVTVTSACIPGDMLSGDSVPTHSKQLLLFVDNKVVDPAKVTWTKPVPDGDVYVATLPSAILPLQSVKALLTGSSAQRKTDSPAKTLPDTPPAVASVFWWVPQPGSKSPECKPPLLETPSSDGGQLIVNLDQNCAPKDLPDIGGQSRNMVIYSDNQPVDPGSVTWTKLSAAPPKYMASLTNRLQPHTSVKVLLFDPAQNQSDSEAKVVPGEPSAAAAKSPQTPAAPATISTRCAAPVLPTTLTDGDDSISITLGCVPNANMADLTLNRNQKADSSVNWVVTSTAPLTVSAKLSNALKSDEFISVVQDGQRDPTDSLNVKVAGKTKMTPPGTIQIVQEGSSSVTGFAPGLDQVRVQLKDGDGVKTWMDAKVDSTTNMFTATFPAPLQADQHLEAFGLSKDNKKLSDTSTPIDVVPFGLDWGRVRGYFTAGMVISNNNSQFNVQNANTFLDFTIDKAWTAKLSDPVEGKFFPRWRFNSFFDARLTAIPSGVTAPASTAATTPTVTAGTTPSTTTGTTGSAAGTTAASTGNPSVNVSSLLANSQAALLQGGAYLPFTVGAWETRGRSYSLYVAPLAKAGFYTLTSAGSSASQSAETANRNNGRFFPFYAFGGRLGHYEEYTDSYGRPRREKAPKQLSYLDFTFGRWANFETLQPFNFNNVVNPSCVLPATDPTTANCDVRHRLWRGSVEGLLVVPNTPLVVGFSANVGLQRGHLPGVLQPPDDLRFLFGVRFDASQFTALLTKLGGK